MTDKEIVAHSRSLHAEAADLLNTEGLLPMLKSFGTTRVIGSYTLDTMTWRDIDISMKLPDAQDVALFFEIGNKIATKFQVTKMSYSNHFIRNFPGFDHGLYWGIQLLYADQEWKIDLWGYGETDYHKHMAEFDTLHNQIQQADCTAILRIKHAISQRSDYRGDVYNSMAVYRAVLTEKVTSLEEFNEWIERNSHANI
ncbi:MAG: hypothetical protein OXI67_16260 [Candidatus Poribacteria bacterium]|nr:hypothetical protein [Candidatus Poribacteria bacterium]